MRRSLLAALTSVALVTLVAPMLALGQAKQQAQQPAPGISQSPSAGFPDRAYLLQLPNSRALTTEQVAVTENGNPVTSLAVTPPGGSSSGAVLLIDASDSMEGEPLESAMDAARAFLAERTETLPVAIVAFGPEDTVLTDFTTDGTKLAESVKETPATAVGTNIYDALINVADLAKENGVERTTVVLLSDGTDVGSEASRADALAAADEAGIRVISVGLTSPQYNDETLRALSSNTGGKYVETATPKELAPVFEEIGQQLSNEYEVTYRSLLPANREAVVVMKLAGYAPATTTYTTPELDFAPRGTFERTWVDSVITSPWLMLFVVVAVLVLVGFAILTAFDVRKRSLRRRMAQYVTVPTEDESRLRRAEVSQLLSERAHKTVGGQRWWQSFESDVELSGLEISAIALAGWTVIGGVLVSLVSALALQNLWGLLIGLIAPFITLTIIKHRISRKRKAFAEQLPDNIDVLAGALRAGHSLTGAMSQMMEGAGEPSKTEFRRMLQDEQLGVPMDQALMVMRHRMDNLEIEQLAIVTRLQSEAGGNTAEVLDRVAENIRGRMELHRLVRVLTAQGRLAMWILIGMPFALLGFISFINPRHLEPMFHTLLGNISLGAWVVMMILGWWVIRKIVDIDI